MKPALSILFLLATSLSAQDITVAAKSPYDLATFVQTHQDFDWEPLWNFSAVSERGPFLPRCNQNFSGVAPCSSEIIAITPGDVILLLEHLESFFQVYLRYHRTDAGGWRITASYTPLVKYFRPEHSLRTLGAKQFLVVTSQGISGTGLSSELEDWFDLTKEAFMPVLTFIRNGHYYPFPSGIAREVRGTLVSASARPVEQITVSFDAAFENTEKDGTRTPLFSRTDRVVFTRSATGEFTTHEIEPFYDILDDPDPGPAAFLRFAWKPLASIAANPRDKLFPWLAAYLKTCPNTPESRKLKALLP